MQQLSKLLIKFFEIVHSGIATGIKDPNLSYGIAIIVFTAIIRVILLPLNIKQIKSTVKMGEIQPELKKLQAKYKNNPEKLQEETMRIYKENGVNPLGGCLPLLIQMPVLFALFYVFNNLTALNNVSFLWIPKLGNPDPTYILPILSGVTTYFSSAVMAVNNNEAMQAKQTMVMNICMAVFLTVMSLKFKGALVLYWVVNNLFQILQTVLMQKKEGGNEKGQEA